LHSWNLAKITLIRRFNSSLLSYEAKLWIVSEHTKLPKKRLMTNEGNLGMMMMYWTISWTIWLLKSSLKNIPIIIKSSLWSTASSWVKELIWEKSHLAQSVSQVLSHGQNAQWSIQEM
jgi:hypothetical protein